MATIDSPKTPSIGTTLVRDGQRYKLVSVKPHIRRDGSRTVLLCWRTRCAECGTSITVTSPLNPKGLTRRCDVHRHPGKAVTANGRKKKSRHLAR
ncbi:MAG: hypothetical protein ACE5FN_12790, partial [Leptospirillia bacterium]